MPTKLTALLLTTSFLACAVSTETTAAEVQLDDEVAKTQASALPSAVASAQANDGVALAEAVASVGRVAAALVPAAKDGARAMRGPAASTCTCPAGGTSCTFEKCTIGAAVVSGKVSWGGGKIACTDLTFDAPPLSKEVGATYVALDCDLAYSAGRVAGDLHTTGSSVVEGVTYRWNASLVANDLSFSTTTLTGGTLDVSAAVTVAASASEKSYSATAEVALP